MKDPYVKKKPRKGLTLLSQFLKDCDADFKKETIKVLKIAEDQ